MDSTIPAGTTCAYFDDHAILTFPDGSARRLPVEKIDGLVISTLANVSDRSDSIAADRPCPEIAAGEEGRGAAGCG